MGISSPIGKKITIGRQTYVVIGIIKDFHQSSLRKPVEPMILRFTYSTSLCLRINPARKQETISFIKKRKKGYNPDPDKPVRYEILDERINKFYIPEKKLKSILSVFTVIALFTACLGLIGLASFMAEKRTREIGLRKIFGTPVSEDGMAADLGFLKMDPSVRSYSRSTCVLGRQRLAEQLGLTISIRGLEYCW